MSATIEGREYTHTFVGDCPACGGRMLEVSVTIASDERTISFECIDCAHRGRVAHTFAAGIDEPIQQVGVEAVRSGWVRWIDCRRCHGSGRVLATVCDLQRALGRDESCPRCGGSGTVRNGYHESIPEAVSR
ncbi:hypothetical protein [Natronomonas sp. LN261]|uniref:hypothetical protein n=1 Tax=Natronomonas sp. LN261 TaxID=2750669 RepID=UPI0015EEB518|nr:hypothetical protein [Natronomonas sp. LN261]